MAHAAKLPTHSSEHVMMQHHGQLEHGRESQHARQQPMVEREGRSVARLPLPPHPHYQPVKSHHHLPPFPPPPHFGFPAPHPLAAHHHVPFHSPRGELQHSRHSKPLPFALPTEGLKSEMEDEKDVLSGRSNPHDHHAVVKHEDGRLYLGCKKEGCNGILLVEPTTHHGAPYQCPRCLNKQKYCQDCQQLYINFRRHRTLGHELYEFQRKRQVLVRNIHGLFVPGNQSKKGNLVTAPGSNSSSSVTSASPAGASISGGGRQSQKQKQAAATMAAAAAAAAVATAASEGEEALSTVGLDRCRSRRGRHAWVQGCDEIGLEEMGEVEAGLGKGQASAEEEEVEIHSPAGAVSGTRRHDGGRLPAPPEVAEELDDASDILVKLMQGSSNKRSKLSAGPGSRSPKIQAHGGHGGVDPKRTGAEREDGGSSGSRPGLDKSEGTDRESTGQKTPEANPRPIEPLPAASCFPLTGRAEPIQPFAPKPKNTPPPDPSASPWAPPPAWLSSSLTASGSSSARTGPAKMQYPVWNNVHLSSHDGTSAAVSEAVAMGVSSLPPLPSIERVANMKEVDMPAPAAAGCEQDSKSQTSPDTFPRYHQAEGHRTGDDKTVGGGEGGEMSAKGQGESQNVTLHV